MQKEAFADLLEMTSDSLFSCFNYFCKYKVCDWHENKITHGVLCFQNYSILLYTVWNAWFTPNVINTSFCSLNLGTKTEVMVLFNSQLEKSMLFSTFAWHTFSKHNHFLLFCFQNLQWESCLPLIYAVYLIIKYFSVQTIFTHYKECMYYLVN